MLRYTLPNLALQDQSKSRVFWLLPFGEAGRGSFKVVTAAGLTSSHPEQRS